MKIWLLTRKGRFTWDEYLGFVIRAASPSEARAEAKRVCGEEWWLDPKQTDCKMVGSTTIETTGIILASYNGG